jgi:creatinine amidohydrolase
MVADPRWGRYEELRPDRLQEIVREAPVVYWPLGLLENHGWHLPVGFDGLKAQRLCERRAARTGGVVLPVMWWGGEGGHGPFKWTLYQPMEAPEAIVRNTLERLIACGLRAFVLLAGHYPWRSVLGKVLPALTERHPDLLFLGGTEMELGGPDARLPGDHAARWETAYGLALLPEFVDLGALTPGHTADDAWSADGPPPEGERHPGVNFDPAEPLFAQMGEDARTASAEEAERHLARLEAGVCRRVDAFLHEGRSGL